MVKDRFGIELEKGQRVMVRSNNDEWFIGHIVGISESSQLAVGKTLDGHPVLPPTTVLITAPFLKQCDPRVNMMADVIVTEGQVDDAPPHEKGLPV